MSTREPTATDIDVQGDRLAVLEWPGEGDPVLLLHATGFHSRCWNQVVRLLPQQRILAVDLRYHGASDGGEAAPDWGHMSRDIELLVSELGLNNVIGVGHSIGGHLVTRAAAALPGTFRQLLLIDPVIMAPQTYAAMPDMIGGVQATDHPVSRRKNRWIDAEEMFERFSQRPPFDSWQPEILRDYCDYALKPVDEADYLQLACDPINEASIYLNQIGNEVIHDLLPQMTTPATVLRAPPGEAGVMDLSGSPTWDGLAAALPCAREIYLPHHNHFIPMQDPALVANYINEALANRWQNA